YFGDFLATCADLASVTLPESVAHDGVSLVPTLRGSGGQRRHEYLYWEHYGREVIQAVLLEGRWKGIRHGITTAPIALFDLDVDPAEQSDLAARHPAIVARIAATMGTAHVPNERWRIDPAGPEIG